MTPLAVPIAAADTHELRQRVLRPHQRIAEMDYPGDHDATTAHFGCHGDGELVAIGSIYREPRPGGDPDGWRIRGMATAEGRRRAGLGKSVLAACVAHARDHGATEVWCNARRGARALYERAGFIIVGDEFELPGIGPHFLMTLRENLGRDAKTR
jgi:predicted GNAT family N-acyltransferase